MKRLSCMLCLLLAVLLAFIGCSSPGTEYDDTTDTESTTADDAFVRPITPDNTVADLNKAEITVLAWKEASVLEFESSIDGGSSSLSEALYHRNLTVQNHLDCTLDFSYTDGSIQNADSYIKTAQNGQSVDVFAAHNRVIPQLAIKGLCADLNALVSEQGLDFSQPWWPGDLNKSLAVNGSLYFCTGDISSNYLNSIGAVFFNKTLVSEAEIEPNTLYRIASSSHWTMTSFIEYSQTAATEKDGKTAYGFALGINGEYVDFFFEASNFRPTERNDDGQLAFSITDESIAQENSCFVAVYDFFKDDAVSVSWSNPSNGSRLFTEGSAAFTVAPLSYASELNGKIDYGILPVPKYSEDIREGVSPLVDGYTLYAISSSLNDEIEHAAAVVLQSLGAASSNVVLNAFTLDLMGREYSFSDPDIHMLDSMRSNTYFELIDSFYTALTPTDSRPGGAPGYIFRNEILSYTDTIGATVIYSQVIQRHFDSYLSAFDEIVEKLSASYENQ